MSEAYPNLPPEAAAAPRPSLFGHLRAIARLGGALVFTIACSLAGLAVSAAGLALPGRAAPVRRRLSQAWMCGVLWFTGTRITVKGERPRPPYVFVFNHPCWLDFFVLTAVLPEARFVAEAPLKTAPVVGVLFRGLNLLFVKRTQEDTPRITAAVIEALRAGDNIAFAPETPVMDAPRGTVVRPFRGALFEAAVQTGRPVSCAALTYRTPAGCPPALRTVIFHTMPIYRLPGSDTTDAQLESYGAGKIKDFFKYIIGMLALPHHEAVVTFAEGAVFAEERNALANRAHEAVTGVFVPVE